VLYVPKRIIRKRVVDVFDTVRLDFISRPWSLTRFLARFDSKKPTTKLSNSIKAETNCHHPSHGDMAPGALTWPASAVGRPNGSCDGVGGGSSSGGALRRREVVVKIRGDTSHWAVGGGEDRGRHSHWAMD
jgi:hypothetical protein